MTLESSKNEIRPEERLTFLIAAIFDELEYGNQRLFNCGSINLRSAMERFYYFNAIVRPDSLRPLLKAGRDWRKYCPYNELSNLYDELENNFSRHGYSSHIKDFLRLLSCWLTQQFLKISTVFHTLIWPKKVSARKAPIAFFAFSDRFVYFFKNVIGNLHGKECVFLTTNGLVSTRAVSKVGAKICESKSKILPAYYWHIGWRHPLYKDFTAALRYLASNYGLLIKEKPSTVIFAEGTSMEDQVIALAAKYLNIPTLRLQSGRAGILHSGYRGMCFDKMLCWGEGFVERFSSCSPDPEYLVTGNPVLDNKFVLKSSNKKHKKCLGLFTQPISQNITDIDYLVLVKLANLLIDNQIKLVIRKHPSDDSREFDNLATKYPSIVTVMSSDQYTLEEVFEFIDGAIGFYSTTLSEAAAYGVVPIMIKIKDQYSVFPYPEKYGAAILTESENQAFDYAVSLVKEPDRFAPTRERMKIFANYFFGPQDGKALDRILKCINKTSGDIE